MVDDELRYTIERIARRYASRCWWADFEDLRQEGWCIALRAERTWDASRGVSFAGYAGKAVARSLSNYLWSCRSPVTGRAKHNESLRGIQSVSDDLLQEIAASREEPETEQWWRDVRRVLRACIYDDASTVHRGTIAAMVLLDEQTPEQVAAAQNVTIEHVRQCTKEARKRLRVDGRLRTLITDRRYQQSIGVQEES